MKNSTKSKSINTEYRLRYFLRWLIVYLAMPSWIIVYVIESAYNHSSYITITSLSFLLALLFLHGVVYNNLAEAFKAHIRPQRDAQMKQDLVSDNEYERLRADFDEMDKEVTKRIERSHKYFDNI